MTWITLNIGLNIGATEALSAHVVREILAANGIIRRNNGVVHTSDTESTLVIDVLYGFGFVSCARQIAIDLKQDCIAAWMPHPSSPSRGVGALFGPRADAWGPFNPAFFLLADGSRLSDSLPVVAPV